MMATAVVHGIHCGEGKSNTYSLLLTDIGHSWCLNSNNVCLTTFWRLGGTIYTLSECRAIHISLDLLESIRRKDESFYSLTEHHIHTFLCWWFSFIFLSPKTERTPLKFPLLSFFTPFLIWFQQSVDFWIHFLWDKNYHLEDISDFQANKPFIRSTSNWEVCKHSSGRLLIVSCAKCCFHLFKWGSSPAADYFHAVSNWHRFYKTFWSWVESSHVRQSVSASFSEFLLPTSTTVLLLYSHQSNKLISSCNRQQWHRKLSLHAMYLK